MSYKETLNLPHTTFSMKANLNQLEPKMLDFWQQLDIYGKMRARGAKRKYILHDGPPYANGLIHIGHALNKVLKDIIIKYKTMAGYDCPYVVGWDCHGLPVEHQLLKELKLTKYDVDVVNFREKAKIFALRFVELQKNDFKRLGIFSDWDNPYLTLSYDYEYWVLTLLRQLTEQGYVYRGRKPVNWCSTCETALAEAEVEYAQKESHSIYVLFQAKEGGHIFKGRQVCFLVWTTTPWTLISNVAVAVHPELAYSLCEHKGRFIICASDLRRAIEEKNGIALKELGAVKGSELSGCILMHPFIERTVPVVTADFVSREEGSGCVHIAPGHGQEDFSLVKPYNLSVLAPLDDKGIFTEEAHSFQGKNVEEANCAVIEALEANGSLLGKSTIEHSYPHCWRCKKPIIFRATHQWFLSIDQNDLRSKTLAAIDTVQWVPPSGIDRMRSMIQSRPDWCLSRQRLWGIPIPAVRCAQCRTVLLNASVIAKTADVFRKDGSDSWFKLDISRFMPEGFLCPECKGNAFEKEFDILDVWFESGASFLSVVSHTDELLFPADLYLEGSDQHRGWFQASLIPSVATTSSAPFKTILTHGFVVDGEGKKMSKSLGNVIAPQEIIKKYGAEILRLWCAFSDYTEDVRISPSIIKQLVETYRKIRNTLRFILGNLYDFDLQNDHIEKADLEEIDRFMHAKTTMFFNDVIADYEAFNFYRVCQKTFNFCNLDLSSFYLDILKDKLYTYSPNSKERKSAQTVLFYVIKVLLKVIAPILPFTAEEAFGSFHSYKGRKESIFLHDFSDELSQEVDLECVNTIEKILVLREEVLKRIERKREEAVVGSSLEAAVTLTCGDQDFAFYHAQEDLLREIFIVSLVTVRKGEFAIEITKAAGKKCQRCWNIRTDVGSNKTYPQVCARCADLVKGG